MKYSWIWCLVNTLLIGTVFISTKINSDCESAQDQTIRDLMVEVQTMEKVQHNDTVIVNISNAVKVPQHFDVDVNFPEDGQWIMDDPE